MNGVRSRLNTNACRSLQRNVYDALKSLTRHQNVARCFSSETNESGEGDQQNDVYIPRRIKRRMAEKNLNIEDFEIRPVYTDKSSQRTLADSIVDTEINADFPSDFDMTSQINKNVDRVRMQRPEVNPRETSVLLFPGQGSQIVGMGKKLLPYPGVKELYLKANEILGYDILNVCLNGPKNELDKTVHCQPALYVTSLAAIERLKEDYPEVNLLYYFFFLLGSFEVFVRKMFIFVKLHEKPRNCYT